MRIVLYAVAALAAIPAFPISKGQRLPLRTFYTADRTLAAGGIDSSDFFANQYVDSWSNNGTLWIEASIPSGAEILVFSTEQCHLADVFLQSADGGWNLVGSTGESLCAKQKSLDTAIPAVALPDGIEAPRPVRIRLDSTHSSLVELHADSARNFIKRNSLVAGGISSALCAGIAAAAFIVFFGALYKNAAHILLAASCLALVAAIFTETGIGLSWTLFKGSRYIYKGRLLFLCAAALAANMSIYAKSKARSARLSLLSPFLAVIMTAVGILYVLLPFSDNIMKFIPISALLAANAVLTAQCLMQIKENPKSLHSLCLILAAFHMIFLEQAFHAARFAKGAAEILTLFDNDNSIPEIAALFLVSAAAFSQIRIEAARRTSSLREGIRRLEQRQEEGEKSLFVCTELSAMLVNSMQILSAAAWQNEGAAPLERPLILKNGIFRAKQITTAIALLSGGRITADFLQICEEPLNLHDFLARSIRHELSDLKLNNCFIDIHESYPPEECVLADKNRLSLILSFLMQAAARQSRPESAVMISAEYDGRTFAYTVRFHSAPLQADEICRILEQKAQAVSAEQTECRPERNIELYAAKKITDQLKGTFAISPDSDGNTISLRLSLAPAEKDFSCALEEADSSDFSDFSEADGQDIQNHEGPPPSAGTIWILEEERAVRDMLVRLLRPHYRTFALDNGDEFLRLARHGHSDAVICSLTLSGKDAFALLSDGRRDLSAPFIVLAAQSSPKMERELFRLGAVEVIEKPFRPESLLLKVNAIITLRRAHTEGLLQKINASLQNAIKSASTTNLLPPRELQEPERNEIPSERSFAPLTALCISANLTKKEREIAFLIAKNLTDKEIAGALGISPATVAVHNKNIFKKLGIHTRRELLEKAER